MGSVRLRGPHALFAVWLLTSLATTAAGQAVTATTGAVYGTVTDATSAASPGVAVTLAGPTLMTSQTVLTDAVGAYRFSAVPPGDYGLSFKLAGFTTVVREGIRVGVGFTATVDAELRPSGFTDTVSVRGAPIIDLTSTEVTTRFDGNALTMLPGARDLFAVLAITPGIAMSRVDVGGNTALSMQEYSATACERRPA